MYLNSTTRRLKGSLEIKIHEFVILALCRSEWLASCSTLPQGKCHSHYKCQRRLYVPQGRSCVKPLRTWCYPQTLMDHWNLPDGHRTGSEVLKVADSVCILEFGLQLLLGLTKCDVFLQLSEYHSYK